MKLLVDIGNSRLKWTTAECGAIGMLRSVDYRQSDFLDQLSGQWSCIGMPDPLAIASVASSDVKDNVVALANRLWPGVQVLLPRAEAAAFGVTSAYHRPEQLGVDRWLALVGAHRSYAMAACIADCGTALTVDFIEADGRHRGGAIAPGLALMKKTLSVNTAALPLGQARHCIELGLETDAAIASGSLLAAVGLIETVLKRQPNSYQLILTGGDAPTLAGYLSLPNVVDSELVFKGLLCYCQAKGGR